MRPSNGTLKPETGTLKIERRTPPFLGPRGSKSRWLDPFSSHRRGSDLWREAGAPPGTTPAPPPTRWIRTHGEHPAALTAYASKALLCLCPGSCSFLFLPDVGSPGFRSVLVSSRDGSVGDLHAQLDALRRSRLRSEPGRMRIGGSFGRHGSSYPASRFH